jgi:CheY-like chemotaxis protein
MSRILLVDDSPHAQRMGERILSDEGFEVVTVSNADSALIRLDDVDPDVVLADTVMPGRTGYEICQYIKMSPRHKHVRVLLTCGVLETLDEAEVQRVEADGTLQKPFEASALINAVRPLAEAATQARTAGAPSGAVPAGAAKVSPAVPFVAVVDAEQVKAAVTVALDAAMDTMVEAIARRVLVALQNRRPDAVAAVTAAAEQQPPISLPAAIEPPTPALPPPGAPRGEVIRRVSPLRFRSGSILGLDIGRVERGPEESSSEPPASAAESQ